MRTTLIGRLRPILLTAIVAAASFAVFAASAYGADPAFTFKGGGWGHGIGLSQWGAQGYAKQGWGYSKILTHYYQDTRVVTKPTVTVRVNIEDGAASRSQWKIHAGSDTALVVAQESDTSIRKTLDAEKAYWITTSAGNTQLRADASGSPGSVLKTFDGACYATAGGLVQVLSSSGPFNHTGVRWRGTIHFQPPTTTSNTARAVNYVNIEDYLYGVVPRESPSSWHAEALKAQAVAARSYAYQDGVERRTIYCTTKSQVYNGKSRPGHTHEAASTNAAVDATEGRVVWYGSQTEPVKTYFSSCSGGHTADIEDVWTTASPKPYYKGVSDADQDSPYYTWNAGTFSAKTVADKIRALDIARGGGLEYSVASPAIVTGIATERASSGYTHHVRVTWSNGDTFRLTGTTMQSVMGLRSSKFSVTRTYPVVTKTRYQQSDARLAWYGHWRKSSDSRLSGDSMVYSYTAGSSMTARFTGNGIVWVAKKGPSHGKAAVYIDGKLMKTVDLYASSTSFGQTAYSTTSLASGTHTLVIKVLGTKRSSATGTAVPVDALDVVNGTLSQATTSLRRYEQDQERLARLGGWGPITGDDYSGSDALRTTDGTAAFYCTFYGSEVRWIGTKSVIHGKARVSVDGGTAQTIDLYSATTYQQQVLYAKSGLGQDRAHTLKIEPMGVGSGGSGYTTVDAIEIRGGWLLPATLPSVTIDQTHASATWTPEWKLGTASAFIGGSQRWTTSAGAIATLKFDGNEVAWIGRKAVNYGRATVYLDGVYKGAVDLYRSPPANRVTIWSSGRIASGPHTLEIRALGAHSSQSTGNTVGVDAFRVAGRAR